MSAFHSDGPQNVLCSKRPFEALGRRRAGFEITASRAAEADDGDALTPPPFDPPKEAAAGLRFASRPSTLVYHRVGDVGHVPAFHRSLTFRTTRSWLRHGFSSSRISCFDLLPYDQPHLYIRFSGIAVQAGIGTRCPHLPMTDREMSCAPPASVQSERVHLRASGSPHSGGAATS